MRRRATRLVIALVLIVAAAFLLRTFVVAPYYIPSESMEPTLHGCAGCNDDHVLVDKISYRLHNPHQGDIVVFDRPPKVPAEDSVLIKRVVATEDQTVVLRGGRVYVDGAPLKEDYLVSSFVSDQCRARAQRVGTYPLTKTTRWKVPDGDVFVLGDNRCDSMDSRYFGPITQSSIVGRAIAIVWPLKRFRTL